MLTQAKVLVAIREAARSARNFRELLLPYIKLDESASPFNELPQTALYQVLTDNEDLTAIPFDQFQQALIKICNETLDLGIRLGKVTDEEIVSEAAATAAKIKAASGA